jgi:hypothetical protein
MSQQIIRRPLTPVVRVLDAAKGLVEYVASDESLDSYREIIRANGWRFSMFAKNAPFVDSHDYQSLEKLLGQVVDFRVEGKRLIEVVQWAKDVAENKLAQIGWRMTEAGYLKAVSVGFWPVRYVTQGDGPAYEEQLKELKLDPAKTQPRCIYTEQEQIELSACIIGANPNALARSYKAGILTDADLDTLSSETAKRETASRATDPADALLATRRAQAAFLAKFQTAIAAITH